MIVGPSGQEQAWFVYLFALSDCGAFKVGFSCNPFQRIYSFSHRYFERFDLRQSPLLRLSDCDAARAVETLLKSELAEFRADCPPWVPGEAGGHTEWFSALYFSHAEERLGSLLSVHNVERLENTSDFIRGELARLSAPFESWAWSQAQRVCDAWSSMNGRDAAVATARSLRDWLDAYRFFDVPLFADDPSVLTFVTKSAHLSG